jgi:hypothetical protein
MTISRDDDGNRHPTRLLGLGFVTLWISLLAHETGHFAVAAARYSTLHKSQLPADAELSVVSGGLVVTAGILAACGLAVGVFPKQRTSTLRLCISLAMGAASRYVLVAPGTLLGTAVNDERTIAPLLGVSARLIWFVEAGFAAFVLWWLLQWVPSPSRSRLVLWIAAGISIGWVSGLTFGRYLGLPI